MRHAGGNGINMAGCCTASGVEQMGYLLALKHIAASAVVWRLASWDYFVAGSLQSRDRGAIYIALNTFHGAMCVHVVKQGLALMRALPWLCPDMGSTNLDRSPFPVFYVWCTVQLLPLNNLNHSICLLKAGPEHQCPKDCQSAEGTATRQQLVLFWGQVCCATRSQCSGLPHD